jgi:hypothetical protein
MTFHQRDEIPEPFTFAETSEHATAMTVTATVSAISDLAVFSLKKPDELTADLSVLRAAHELLGVVLERLLRDAA